MDNYYLNAIIEVIAKGKVTLDNAPETGVWSYLTGLEREIQQKERLVEAINVVSMMLARGFPTWAIQAVLGEYETIEWNDVYITCSWDGK
jgi:hypothetical protein